MPWAGLKQKIFSALIEAWAGRHAISVPSSCPLRLPLVWRCPPHSRWGCAGARVTGREDWGWTSGRRATDTEHPWHWRETAVGCQWLSASLWDGKREGDNTVKITSIMKIMVIIFKTNEEFSKHPSTTLNMLATTKNKLSIALAIANALKTTRNSSCFLSIQ